jgi:hypothetical protein
MEYTTCIESEECNTKTSNVEQFKLSEKWPFGTFAAQFRESDELSTHIIMISQQSKINPHTFFGTHTFVFGIAVVEKVECTLSP